MMEPDMRPSTATMVYGMRYQMGRMEAIAPIGSLPTFFGEFGVGSGEQQAVEDEKHIGDGRAERGPEDDAAVGGLAGQVA